MAEKRLGIQTIEFTSPPVILSASAIAGKKEGEGPLSQYFDVVIDDDLFGEETWEKAESKMLREAAKNAVDRAGLTLEDINYLFSGDLLNQIISASFSARELRIPFFGLYGACSTMTESLSLSAMAVDGGYADYALAATGSHFCTAERQYRYPLELGSQRSPTAQWTVTGTGAAVVAKEGKGPVITHVTTGRVMDFGIKDANNMGAAMAPAAADTIIRHLKDTGFSTDYYDYIITGDLGSVGVELLKDILRGAGISSLDNINDCGLMIFDMKSQDVHSGASGCGCSASVFCGYLYKMLSLGSLKKILLLSTGALMSPTSTMQGETIPGIAHAISIVSPILRQ